MATEAFSVKSALVETYEQFASHIIQNTPQILGAIFLLFAGWILALSLRAATRKLIGGFDWVFKRAAKTGSENQFNLRSSYASIIGNAVYWVIILFFVAAAANTLGWKMFSGWMDNIITQLPSLIAGLLIILAGFLLGNGLKTATISTALTTGIEHGELLGRSVQVLVILTSIIIGAGQIGINVHLLSNTLIVSIGVLFFGGALAFGLGAKTLIENVIGAQYARKHCRIGENVVLGDLRGVLIEVTPTSMILETQEGRVIVPAKKFQEEVIQLSSNIAETEN